MDPSALRTCTHAVLSPPPSLSAPSTTHPSPQACSTPPSAYPFHELDNVVMSPHRGGGVGTPDLELLRMRHVGRALTEAGRNGVGQMSHRWDFARGY
jgi:hypothetical protein